MKKILLLFIAGMALCAIVVAQTQKQCSYTEDELSVREKVLQNADSMAYYNALAEQGDARAQYIMASSYYYTTPVPDGVLRIRTRQAADSLLNAAAEQGYKPAIKTIQCFRKCGSWHE